MSATNARGNRVERVLYADRNCYLYDLALCKLHDSTPAL